MASSSPFRPPLWVGVLLGLGGLAIVVLGFVAEVAQRGLEEDRLEKERLARYHESDEFLQIVAAEKLAWEGLMVRRSQLRVGLSEAEVREIMGTQGSRYGGPFDPRSEATSRITYHLERQALGEAYIRIWFDRGGVSSIVTVPGYELPFVSSDWIRFDHDYRGFMAADLVESELLIGRTREEVVSLLGKPRYSKPRHTAWRYDLGDAASAPRPEGLLLVLFEDQDSGRVIEASTHVD